MRWVGYLLGLIVGAAFGFWVHTFWEELTGIGASRPPSFDFYVPLVLFLVATGVLIAVKRRN